MARILLALQFWQGDKEQAGKLARFIADQQIAHSQEVDLLLSGRWDCDPDPEVARYCSRAFNVYTTKGHTQLTGHPAGSWALWHDTVEFVRDGSNSGRLPRYDCVLTFEADCVPLTKDWAVKLLGAWLRDGRERIALGHEILPKVSPYPHLNGNLLISGAHKHLDSLVRFACSPRSAWDLKVYGLLKLNGCKSIPEIRSGIFKKVGGGWVKAAIDDGVVFVHGDKDGSVFDAVRSKTAGGAFVPYGVEDVVKPRGELRLFPSVNTWNETFEVTNTVEDKSGRIAVGIRQHLYRPERRFEICRIDDSGRTTGHKTINGLWVHPGDGRTTLHSEPNLVAAENGKMWLSYTTETAYPAFSTMQHLAEIDVRSGRVRLHADLGFVASNRDNVNPAYRSEERNWRYFWHGNLNFPLFVGQTKPFHVGNVEKQVVSVSRSNALFGWPGAWGHPAATTNPVKVDNEWFGFFHSVGEFEGNYRGMVGAYSFYWDGETFVNHKVSMNPLLVGSGIPGFAWPRGARYWEWPDVKVTGAEFSRGVWKLVGSLNYHRNFFLDIPHKSVVELFTQRPILSVRQQSRSPHRDGP